MIILTYYNQEWLHYHDGYEEEVTDIQGHLSYLIKSAKNGEIIYLSEMDRFYKDIVAILCDSGFTRTLEWKNKNIKSKEFSTLISKQTGIGDKCYYFKIRISSRKLVMIYGLQNVITERPEDVLEAYKDDSNSIAKAYYTAIRMLNEKVEGITGHKLKKVPMTINGYATKCMRYLTYHKYITPIDYELLPKELWVYDAKGRPMADTIDWFSNAYHGGIVYKNGDGVVYVEDVFIYDANSLYSTAMKYPMPCGELEYHKGKPDDDEFMFADKGHICMWIRMEIDIELLPDGIPFIQLNKRMFKDSDDDVWLHHQDFADQEAIKNSNGKIEITLCYPDYKSLEKNYSVVSVNFLDYFTCLANDKIFDKYINLFYNDKMKQKGAPRHTSKRLLNTCTGAMSKSRINYNVDDFDSGKPTPHKTNVSYIHIGSYITSNARAIWLKQAEKIKGNLKYGDTDSHHIVGRNDKIFNVGNKLGQFKIEGTADFAWYYKKKCYLHLNKKADELGEFIEIKITKAGTPYESVRNLEIIIERLYNEPKHDVLSDIMDLYSQYENYEVDRFVEFLDKLDDIVSKAEYERLTEMKIPVVLKRKDAPFSYTYIIRWEKFTDSILDKYM